MHEKNMNKYDERSLLNSCSRTLSGCEHCIVPRHKYKWTSEQIQTNMITNKNKYMNKYGEQLLVHLSWVWAFEDKF